MTNKTNVHHIHSHQYPRIRHFFCQGGLLHFFTEESLMSNKVQLVPDDIWPMTYDTLPITHYITHTQSYPTQKNQYLIHTQTEVEKLCNEDHFPPVWIYGHWPPVSSLRNLKRRQSWVHISRTCLPSEIGFLIWFSASQPKSSFLSNSFPLE